MKIRLLLCVFFTLLIQAQTFAGLRVAKITQFTGEVKLYGTLHATHVMLIW